MALGLHTMSELSQNTVKKELRKLPLVRVVLLLNHAHTKNPRNTGNLLDRRLRQLIELYEGGNSASQMT